MNLQEAETKINQVLAELESSTGQLVERIELYDIDVTRIDRMQILRSVRVTLKPIPGSSWQT